MIDGRVQHCRFTLLCILLLIASSTTIVKVTRLALADDRYGHILLIPFISFILIYLRRKEIFSNVRPSLSAGALLLAVGAISSLGLGLEKNWLNPDSKLLISVLALVVIGNGAFLFCYGKEAFRHARFALLFLLFVVPLPSSLLDKAVVMLQYRSAEISYVLFKLLGIPVFVNGVNFSLPGVDIEIARECSGIRSCISLFITSVLGGYVFLRTTYSRVSLVVLTIPIAIFKNAVRITAISWLGLYVNRDFFFGVLHKHGGLPFALLAVMMLLPFVYVFRDWESRMIRRADTLEHSMGGIR
jgi:exosortase